MVAIGGVTLLTGMFGIGVACMIPSATGLLGCVVFRRCIGRKAGLPIRVLLWGMLAAGMIISLIPAMYLYLIVSNW